MSSSGYTAITFVANEQPTTAKWNLIGSNDASFNSGNGFEDSTIITRHIANSNVTTSKLKVNYTEKRGNNGASRQVASGAGTYLIAGSQFTYTTGPTAELLYINGQALVQDTAAGGQMFIFVNSTQTSRSSYVDNDGASYFRVKACSTFFEAAANTTYTIDLRYKIASGTITVANASSDDATGYGLNVDMLAFGR